MDYYTKVTKETLPLLYQVIKTKIKKTTCSDSYEYALSKMNNDKRCEYLCLFDDKSYGLHPKYNFNEDYSKCQILTNADFIEYIITGKVPVQVKTLQFGEYKVVVTPNQQIKFGCTTLSAKDVEELYQAFKGN